jgi:putative DNA methylase
MNDKRLIETAFPLAEASAASLHEKNMRHGHISTLHVWPARRPLAAARAAIAAALLSDPSSEAERAQLVRRLGGRLKPAKKRRNDNGTRLETEKLQAEGGVLWWGREASPDMTWLIERIRETNGGRPPRVLDPFAGGGAIPLAAMQLGREVVANDLNPVSWFILKCTLEYPSTSPGRPIRCRRSHCEIHLSARRSSDRAA